MNHGIETETQQKIIRLINALIPQAKIYLFGSRARGTHGKWSDIDLALDAGEQLPISVVGEAGDVMKETNIPYKIEVVDFHNVSPEMQASIRTDGVLWKL